MCIISLSLAIQSRVGPVLLNVYIPSVINHTSPTNRSNNVKIPTNTVRPFNFRPSVGCFPIGFT